MVKIVEQDGIQIVDAQCAPHFSPYTGERALMGADIGPLWTEALRKAEDLAVGSTGSLFFKGADITVEVNKEDQAEDIGKRWREKAYKVFQEFLAENPKFQRQSSQSEQVRG